MPPPLVYATASRYGVTTSPTATAPLVYSMARDMGASYEAVVRQLDNLDVINRHKRDELLSIQPATIKAQLALGHRPVGNVDVWPVDVRSSGGAITVTEGDEVVVMLPENRTTGYKWLTEDDLRARAGRRVHPAPLVESGAHGPDPEPGWTPAIARGTQSRKAVDRALLAIRGNAGATRILPGADPAGPDTDQHGLDPDEAFALQAVPELRTVEDFYRPSWTSARPSELRSLRRSIARGEVLPAVIDTSPTPSRGAAESASPTTADLLVGGTGTRLIALRSSGEGRDSFRLVYSSAYDASAAAAESYEIDVTIACSPATAQRKHHLSAAAQSGVDDDSAESQGRDQGGHGGVDGD